MAVPDRLGWLLALRATQRLATPTHVRMTGHVASPGGWDRPTRVRVATAARRGADAVVDGVVVCERLAERRWLAWFPRPVGPRHAVNVGGPSVAELANLPGLRLVRTHLTVSSMRAEALQATANLAGTGIGGRLLDRWVARGDRVDDAQVRWACVVEVTDHDRDLVRAWAHGWAPGATGAALAAILDHDRTVAARPGTTTVADLDATRAREVLDALGTRTGLRWSMTGPVRR